MWNSFQCTLQNWTPFLTSFLSVWFTPFSKSNKDKTVCNTEECINESQYYFQSSIMVVTKYY
jgi:hypothetical protein